MKTVLFISVNKVLGQGLSQAIKSKPEMGFKWIAQLSYSQAAVGVDIFRADEIILDIVDRTDAERALELCRGLRKSGNGAKLILLVRPDQAVIREKAIEAKNAGLVDDFVFYDSSLAYLLAKLSAF